MPEVVHVYFKKVQRSKFYVRIAESEERRAESYLKFKDETLEALNPGILDPFLVFY